MLVLAITALALAAPVAAAPKPRLTLTEIEPYVMCLSCKEALNVAQSPEAASERSFISGLIAKGETKAQILNALVGQYGPTVLAVPRATGFNLVFYILPPVLLLAGIASLAVLLPRWRRRARVVSDQAIAAGPGLDTADAKRLDEELARYDG
jgi:cytochrome c-type biogenesis protein CcmH